MTLNKSESIGVCSNEWAKLNEPKKNAGTYGYMDKKIKQLKMEINTDKSTVMKINGKKGKEWYWERNEITST